MDSKYHVAFCVGENRIGVGGNVVEEVVGALHGIFGGCGLGGGKGAEGNKDCCVDCSTVIKKGADDLLDIFFLFLG